MKVYTYYNTVPGLEDPTMSDNNFALTKQKALIDLWVKSWSSWPDWEPVILTEADAKNANPDMYARFNVSPLLESRNPPEYMRATLLRWVAMTAVQEPCLHVDWDVFCAGVRPDQLDLSGTKPVFLSRSTCPCAIAASPQGWKLLAAMMELAPFIPKFSREELLADSGDQYATSISSPEYYDVHPEQLCALFGKDPGWENAPMVHFANCVTPKPRSAVIGNMRRFFGP